MTRTTSIITILVVILALANVNANRTPLKRKKSKKTRKTIRRAGGEQGVRKTEQMNTNKSNTQKKNEEDSFEKRTSPFGEIEKVFVDTLQAEDEEFGRMLPVVIEPMSYEIVILDPVPPKRNGGPKGYKAVKGKGKGKGGKLRHGYGYGKGKGKGKGGYGYGYGKVKGGYGKGKGKGGYGYGYGKVKGGYGKGKGKNKKGYGYGYGGEIGGETKVVVEEIIYYGSGSGSKPCKYGDPKYPCAFSGPQDDDIDHNGP